MKPDGSTESSPLEMRAQATEKLKLSAVQFEDFKLKFGWLHSWCIYAQVPIMRVYHGIIFL